MKFTPFSADRKSSHQFTNLSVRITQEDVGYTVRVRLYSHAAPEKLASAEDRLPGSRRIGEYDVILGVVRAGSVHKASYGHRCEGAAAAPLVA